MATALAIVITGPADLAAAKNTGPFAISAVGADPKTLDVRRRGTTTIRYTLSHPASVLIELVNETGHVVRRLGPGKQSAGTHAAVWNGRSTQNKPVPSGVYRYVIRAEDKTGNEAIYDPSQELGAGEELQPRDFQFEPASGSLQWVMPKAGYARLRVGIEGFPHLRTLLDWEPMEAGRHTARWDGLDSSGLVSVKNHPRLSIKLNTFSIPINTILVQGEASADPLEISEGPAYTPSFSNPHAYLHATHPRSLCHEVRLRIEFPEETPRDEKGRPILRGAVPIRLVLDEQDALQIVNERFEIAFFEDLTVIFEEEEGLNPFTFLWDTTHVPPGEHLLTVNVLSYDDHFGVQTQQVIIGENS